MESNQTTKSSKFATLIVWTERLFLMTFILGFIMQYLYTPESRMTLQISLAGLSIAFFASAFVPKRLFSSQEEADQYGPLGMLDLLGLIILPKTLWISSAVSVFGIFAYKAEFGNDGYQKLLTVGGLSITISLAILTFALINGTKKLNTVTPILLRAIPLLIIDGYILLSQ